MAASLRVVVGTNAWVRRLLLPGSVPALAARKAVDEADVLVSGETLDELIQVLSRPKFDRYVTIAERQDFIRLLGRIAEMIPVIHAVRACRDPRDDKFLALCVNGKADVIITGDEDLLALHPFRGIAIRTPSDFLAQHR
jgi:putative PIN family toxin of toxin-antitoxin system